MGRLAEWRRVARAHPGAADTLLAAALFVASLLPGDPAGGPVRPPLTVGAVLLAALGCGALTMRRRHPLPVLVLTTATVVLGQLTGLARGPLVIGVAIAAYTVATRTVRPPGRTVPDELPTWLGVPRSAQTDAPIEPAPSLNRLDCLVEGFSTGQPVRWTVAGQPRPLPTAVDAAAYRIIQEALTNAHRHASGAAVAVRLRYDPHGVTVEVRDEGGHRAPSPTPSAGLGLAGMRARVEAVDGTLTAGPRAGGGWSVRAELPAAEEEAE
ncbi:ATP-binding protein [Micromonospora sp. NPDC047548]|uniref:sensor histidine kinase n=1 Tax=Micromonospora sp. NPDC047548 TaxID=3155624 RepID=UPI0033EEEC8F